MIKIPENEKYTVTNGADTKPNITYTKNVDFDEEGYIRLSAPMCKLYSSADDSDLYALSDMFNYTTFNYKLFTADGIFTVSMGTNPSVTKDTTATALGGIESTRVAGYSNNEYLTNLGDGIYHFNGPSTWTQRNTAFLDFLTEFPSRQTYVARGGSTGESVSQYAEANLDNSPVSTSPTGPNLKIPNYLQISGLAYSNYRIGVATRHSGQGNAFFFTWDGASAEANTGTPVDAPAILDVIAYKNSWVVLTSRGQLLYFNGGGFDDLGNLPPYYFRVNWINANSSSFQYGRILTTDNELIFVNIGSMLDSDEDDSGILPGFYSGVWCYDPLVGLYHRHALSNSQYTIQVITPTDNVFTSATPHLLTTGDKVLITSNTYYAKVLSSTTFKLGLTYEDAQNGITESFIGSFSVRWILREDWSQLITPNNVVGFVKKFDNNVSQKNGHIPFFAGSFLVQPNMGVRTALCVQTPKFDNLGAVEFYKVKSNQIDDTWQRVYVKHRPLTDGDRIVVKYKVEDGPAKRRLGEADTTPARFATWSNSTTFTFSNTWFNATGWVVGDEVEFLSGAGAGQTAHIVSINLSGGTWTVVVDEPVKGAVNTARSTLVFSKYQKLETIDTSNQNNQAGYFEAGLNETSKWIQIKIEMQGVGVTLEELTISNQSNKYTSLYN